MKKFSLTTNNFNITKLLLSAIFTFLVTANASECDEETMDAFAYEDCINSKVTIDSSTQKNTTQLYEPFKSDAYLTSSFGENRGTRYHAGLDYSTQMQEGLPIFAPENGRVIELRVSPFGYGKVMFFKGESSRIWVLAHQSSFGKLDALVLQKQYSTKKNDVTLKLNAPYKKGDTLTFSGSTGIGNPHLHLEVRLDADKILNPVLANVAVSDTIAPQVFGIAIWQGNNLAVTPPDAIDKHCVVTPVKNEFNLDMAVKVADYSREPKENPMSIRRISLWRYDEKIFEEILDTLRFSKMANIRDQLLWAEEADTAGDWHVIQAKLAPLSTYTLELEDFNKNITTKKFSFHPKCKAENSITYVKEQTSPLFTFLSRPMLDLFRCENGMTFTAKAKDSVVATDLCKEFKHEPITIGRILEIHPEMTSISYNANFTGDNNAIDETIEIYSFKKNKTNVTWSTKIGEINITQKITGLQFSNDTTLQILAVTRTHTDSLNFLEFHPKGLQLKNWNVCIENATSNAPLYWLGETSRNWFIFSKQNGSKKRCTNANELRDIANIDSVNAPILGFPYWADFMTEGVRQPALKIPVIFKYVSIANGNDITIKSNNKWIAAEYDSEPREIIIDGEKLPEAGHSINVQIVDEAKNKVNYEVDIPEF